MQIEIKFKAWVKPNELTNHPNGVIADAEPNFYESDCLIKRLDVTLREKFKEIFELDRIELMKFAGCVNGIDIYEGYIIQGWFDTGRYAKGKVVFNESRAAFMVSMWDRPNVMFYLDEIKKLSVIGNVYENPELLEAE